jgi:CheY-like chemotaxis protein
MEQVVMNMAINARDAMPGGGKLTIRTSNILIDEKISFRNRELDAGEYVMLSISDTGIGMSEEIQSHLFEPFFTTKGIGKGTGLGLATCYGIISQSGGDIRVYSEPDAGTTFKIYLPRINAPLDPAPSAETDKMPRGKESVLIVEDDRTVRTMIVSALEQCGYKIREATDGVEALQWLESGERFDLVVTDVIMPRMSGKELYERVKKFSPASKVLFISGYTDDVLAHSGFLSEGAAFLEKPFSPARMARKVRDILDGVGEKSNHERRLVTAD